MKIAAVVLHYRFWPGILSTLVALRGQTEQPDRIVVVDNGSGDGSAERLRRAGVELVEAGANLGYGAGMNLGMAHILRSDVDAVLLLTHECRLAPDAVEALSRRLEDEPGVGAVGPLLAYRSRPDVVFSAGGQIDARGWRTDHVRDPSLVAQWAGRSPVDAVWLDGAAVLLRSCAVRQAGMLDEEYFLYFEETEYFLKLRALGWRVECVPAAIGWQEPSRQPTYLRYRNRLRFLARTAPKHHVIREASRLTGSVVLNAIAPNPKLTPEVIRERRKALLHFLTRRWGPPPLTSPTARRDGRETATADTTEERRRR